MGQQWFCGFVQQLVLALQFNLRQFHQCFLLTEAGNYKDPILVEGQILHEMILLRCLTGLYKSKYKEKLLGSVGGQNKNILYLCFQIFLE